MRAFDLIVIGAGSGNSIVDERFAHQRVAILDNGRRFGGTCLNYGCIPTKMFVLPADLLASPADAARVGVHLPTPSADWAQVRDRIFGRIDAISDAGQTWRADNPEVTLFRDTGRFVGPKVLRVGQEEITAEKIVIAAGSRAVVPSIPGLSGAFDAGLAHTSDTVMRLDSLPPRITILGTGYIGAEFAHVFSAFGSHVTMIGRSDRVLSREDDAVSERYTTLLAERIDLRLQRDAVGITVHDATVTVTTRGRDGSVEEVDSDILLVATGRTPNSDTLDVAAAGIAVDPAGFVIVDDQQRTNVPGVWALGDVSSPWMLKHVANHEARIVAHNLHDPEHLARNDRRPVPHAVFGHPQIAAVGLTEREAREGGLDVVVAVQDYAGTAYGWAMEDDTSFVKIVADARTGRILGAHALGPQASLLIQPLISAMTFDLRAADMARGQFWIHPALTEVVENALLGLGRDR